MYDNFAKFCVFFLCIMLAVSFEDTSRTSSGYYGKKKIWIAYLDSAAKVIGKAKNSSITQHNAAGMSYLELADEMIHKAKINFPTFDKCHISPQPILDCSDLLGMGHKRSGVYTVSPRKTLIKKKAFDVYCDMETDGGGWTVIQRRGDFEYPVDYFYKDWRSYKEGFGNLEKEFWLGNDNIFALTNQEIYSARFDLADVENNTAYAHYDEFWIDGENSKYTLHLLNYSGDAGDSMAHSNNRQFSTKDQDNDPQSVGHCAEGYKGGWWFNNCHSAHLNGENFIGKGVAEGEGKIWLSWKGSSELLARTEIKIRPKKVRS